MSASENAEQEEANDAKPDPNELVASFSRDFMGFDVLPVAVVATALSVALAGTDGGSKSISGTRIVEAALQATPSSLVIWWFSIVGLAALARPLLRLLTQFARMDGTISGKTKGRFVHWGWFGGAVGDHLDRVGGQKAFAKVAGTRLRTVEELRTVDPAAHKIVMEHRERWEVTLRLSVATFIAGFATAIPLHQIWWASGISGAVGLVCATLLYRQAGAEYEQFSKVFCGAVTPIEARTQPAS